MHFLATFIQDTFRVNRQLTLNLGLRWDPFFPYTDVNDRLGCYRPGEESQVYVNAPVGVVYPGDAACPDGGYDRVVGRLRSARRRRLRSVRRRQEQHPRRLRHVLRPAEHDLDQQPGEPGAVRHAGHVPRRRRQQRGEPVRRAHEPVPGRSVQRAGGRAVLPAACRVQLRPEPENGRLQSWNVTVEREIMPTYLVRVAYAGSKGDRLAMGRELNAADLRAGRDDGDDQPAPAAVPDLQHITTIESTGRSIYTALQLTLDKRMSKRFSVLSSYTLSKSKDHAGEAKQTGATQTNPFDLEFDWGYANADRRHRCVTSVLWQIPGEFDNAVADAVLSDWSLTGHPGHAERRRLHGDERRRQRPDRHGRSARRHLRRSRRCRPIGRTRRRSWHGSTRRCTRRTRWARSATRRRNELRGPGLEERRSRPAQDVLDRRRARSCRSASRRSTCSTG